MSEHRKLFAVLIDGDNVQVSLLPKILDTLKQYGDLGIKRVYGDWSQEQLRPWRDVVSRYVLETRHSFHASIGKNSTDIALVIDAMDILWESGNVLDGFCIVSSDSDFSHLALRIRKQGLEVIGVGRESAVTGLKDAVDIFIPTDNLLSNPSNLSNLVLVPETSISDDMQFERFLINIYRSLPNRGENGWVQLAEIRNSLQEIDPDFALRDYRYTVPLAQKIEALAHSKPKLIEVDKKIQPDGKTIIHFVRINLPYVYRNQLRRFRTAYKKALEDSKHKNGDGFLDLSQVGTSLKQLYPENETLSNGTVRKLKNLVMELASVYPHFIEFVDIHPQPRIRIK
jgi:uncharacterized LabA/DUF88 family protein